MKGKNMLFFGLFALVAVLFALGGCGTATTQVALPSSDIVIAYGNVDVARMARMTNIPQKEIATAFGVPYDDENADTHASAKTFEEWESVYWNTPEGSEERKAAFARITALAKTFEEWLSVYWKTPEGSEERKTAIRTLATFFPKKK